MQNFIRFDNLVFRYEEPSFSTRWDSPLIVIPYTDESLPIENILLAIEKGNLRPPNLATQHVSQNSTNWYYHKVTRVMIYRPRFLLPIIYINSNPLPIQSPKL